MERVSVKELLGEFGGRANAPVTPGLADEFFRLGQSGPKMDLVGGEVQIGADWICNITPGVTVGFVSETTLGIVKSYEDEDGSYIPIHDAASQPLLDLSGHTAIVVGVYGLDVCVWTGRGFVTVAPDILVTVYGSNPLELFTQEEKV